MNFPLFRSSPALYYGTIALSTAASPWLGIISIFLSPQRWRLGFIAALILTLYTTTFHPSLPCLSDETEGSARLFLTQMRFRDHPLGPTWILRAHIRTFSSEKGKLHNVPCTIYLPEKLFPDWDSLPSPAYVYEVEGKLKTGKQCLFTPKNEWTREQKKFTLLSWRHACQTTFRQWIERRYENPTLAHFFYALTCGEVIDLPLQDSFSRLGLIHLFAVSGLHFSLFSLFFTTIGQILLPYRWSRLFAFTILSLYFTFLGYSPSVLRAAIMSGIALLAVWFERAPSSLHSLGIALLAAIFWDPRSIHSTGFQLSYGITASILLLYPYTKEAIETIARPLSFIKVKAMPLIDQHGYLLFSFLRESLALALAVNAFSIPYLLLYTKSIPLAGLYLNLFIPPLLSISLFAFLLECLLFWAPGISPLLHSCTAAYTDTILSWIIAFPAEWEMEVGLFAASSA